MRELGYWFGLVLFFAFVAAVCEPEKAGRVLGRAIHAFRSEVAAPIDAGAP